MRNNKTNLGKVKRHRMQRQRIREAQIELARQAEFLANANTQGATMDEHGETVNRCDLENRHYALIDYGIGMHGWKKAHAMQMRIGRRCFYPFHCIGRSRIQQEVTKEPIRI